MAHDRRLLNEERIETLRRTLPVMPPGLPSMLELFIAEVVPILQRRGLFRTACAGETLTANYQLARSDMRFG